MPKFSYMSCEEKEAADELIKTLKNLKEDIDTHDLDLSDNFQHFYDFLDSQIEEVKIEVEKVMKLKRRLAEQIKVAVSEVQRTKTALYECAYSDSEDEPPTNPPSEPDDSGTEDTTQSQLNRIPPFPHIRGIRIRPGDLDLLPEENGEEGEDKE